MSQGSNQFGLCGLLTSCITFLTRLLERTHRFALERKSVFDNSYVLVTLFNHESYNIRGSRDI